MTRRLYELMIRIKISSVVCKRNKAWGGLVLCGVIATGSALLAGCGAEEIALFQDIISNDGIETNAPTAPIQLPPSIPEAPGSSAPPPNTNQQDLLNTLLEEESVTAPPVTPVVTPAARFTEICAGCHGADGMGLDKGPRLGPMACVRVNCADGTALADYIAANMPVLLTGQCVDACATDTAQHIMTAFANNPPQTLVGDLLPQAPAVQRQMFAARCAACHGVDGGGANYPNPIGPMLCARVNCSDIAALYQFVETFMPADDPTACVQECALAAAQLIQGGFVAQRQNNVIEGMDAGDIVRTVLKNAVSITVFNTDTGQAVVIDRK